MEATFILFEYFFDASGMVSWPFCWTEIGIDSFLLMSLVSSELLCDNGDLPSLFLCHADPVASILSGGKSKRMRISDFLHACFGSPTKNEEDRQPVKWPF